MTLRLLLPVFSIALLVAPPSPAELLYISEGNRLRVIDVATLGTADEKEYVLIERASLDPVRGRDINGMICPLGDGSGRFIASEDTGQPETPAGWALLEADGSQVGKLTPTSGAEQPEPYGCAFDAEGRLFTTEIGDPGFGGGNGQLILWFPPFEHFPGPAGAYPDTDAKSRNFCKIATDIGTANGIVIDAAGRVYVAASSGLEILRFLPPFPTSPDPAGGCGRRDPYGSPLADAVARESFVGLELGSALATYAGLAFAPNGNLYAASVLTGRIGEFDPEGRLVRLVLRPPDVVPLPPFETGTPQGLAVGADGTLYYADLDLVWSGFTPGPGPDGKVWRIRFDEKGNPLPPERLKSGLAFPDGVAVLPARADPESDP